MQVQKSLRRPRAFACHAPSTQALLAAAVLAALAQSTPAQQQFEELGKRGLPANQAKVTKSGGIALCAPIAPYDAVRREVRAMIAVNGGFQLVYVSTPLSVCEGRDRKGLYAKARAGQIAHFTGISDPYEAPTDADLVLDTTDKTPEAAAQELILHLERHGFLAAPGAAS